MFEGKALRNIIIAGAILLLGLVGFLAYSNQQVVTSRAEVKQKVVDITNLLRQKEEEMLELEVLFEDREQEVEVRNRLLKQKRIELVQLRDQIEELKRTKQVDQKTIAALEEKLAKMEAQMNDFQEREMDQLLARVLIQKNLIDSITVDSRALRVENQNMRKQLGLAEVVTTPQSGNANSLPNAENFAFYLLLDGARQQVVAPNASDVKTMEVCFELLESVTIPIGDYDLYMVYIDANGEVLTQGSSENLFAVNGNRSFFTAKKNIRYDGGEQTICMPISFDKTPPKGGHEVQIYCKESVIGRGTFRVK